MSKVNERNVYEKLKGKNIVVTILQGNILLLLQNVRYVVCKYLIYNNDDIKKSLFVFNTVAGVILQCL